jgi:hypothetical protein
MNRTGRSALFSVRALHGAAERVLAGELEPALAVLALFGAAMASSLGVKEPLDSSVFSASGAALLLAFTRAPRPQ